MFSAYTAVRVLPDDPPAAERVLRYLLRSALANIRTRTGDATWTAILLTTPLLDSPQLLTSTSSSVPKLTLSARDSIS